MDLASIFKNLNQSVIALAGLVTALGVIIAAGIKLRSHFTRSRLLVPNAFPLPAIPGDQVMFSEQVSDLSTLLVGRDADVQELTRAVQQRPLTFLYGESGSGKSTLLKLGLARELNQSKKWIPIYVDSWGQDWALGPQKSLADATDFALRALALSAETVTPETVFSRLLELRNKTGRRPILLLDQLDDYQNANRQSFRSSESGLLLDATELCAANPFWRGIRDLLLSAGEPVHVLLTIREDAKAGLHCFQFQEPGVYRLRRLDTEEAKQLVYRIATPAVISKPENGFNELIQRLITDLGKNHDASVLPMQLRVALAGIGRLSGH